MIVVAGFVRVSADLRDALQPHLERYVAACRAEAGCRAFTLAYDALDPEIMRVFEIFDDDVAFATHNAASHVAAWREAREGLGVVGRDLVRYEIAASEAI